MKRLDLPGGQHADLRERLIYSQAQPVRVVMAERRLADLDIALVRAYVQAWSVLDPDGNAVPLDTPEAAPDDVVQAIAVEAMRLWNGAALPKAGPGRSRGTQRAAG